MDFSSILSLCHKYFQKEQTDKIIDVNDDEDDEGDDDADVDCTVGKGVTFFFLKDISSILFITLFKFAFWVIHILSTFTSA